MTPTVTRCILRNFASILGWHCDAGYDAVNSKKICFGLMKNLGRLTPPTSRDASRAHLRWAYARPSSRYPPRRSCCRFIVNWLDAKSGIRKLQQFPRTDRFAELIYFYHCFMQKKINEKVVFFVLLFASMPAVVNRLL